MIYCGLNPEEKQKKVADACSMAKKCYVFHGMKDFQEYHVDCPIEYFPWSEVIMYRSFYRLLEEIGSDSVIVVDEMMRTQNRSDLTYNCMHHYLNQCGTKLVFEYFPLIEKQENFMILADFEDKHRWHGKPFSSEVVRELPVKFIDRSFSIETIPVEITDSERKKYDTEKEKIFSGEIKDPESLPRRMALVVGGLKKKMITPGERFVARNSRFKSSNVFTYSVAPSDCIMIDPASRMIELLDYLKRTEVSELQYLNSGLPVDEYYLNHYREVSAMIKEVCRG